MTTFKDISDQPSCRLLLIEDDPDDALLFRHALPEGCELHIVNDGEAGYKAAAELRPDIIFLDMMLPKLSGSEVCKKIRGDADPMIARIPIVMLSTHNGLADAVIGRVIGANDYVGKPYHVQIIQEMVLKHVSAQNRPKRKSNKILVIEDDPEDVDILKALMGHDKRQSYELVHMDTLEKGLGYLSEVTPDLIITDLNLPDSHGVETFKKIFDTIPQVPILVISSQSDELDAEAVVHMGAQDYLVKSGLTGLLLSRAVRYAIERHRLMRVSREWALTDDLTGLCNRRAFLFLLEQQIKICRREKRLMVLAYIDIDKFKAINDTYGHETGDQALIQTAELLRTIFRESDVVARLGGDEFAVLQVGGSALTSNTLRSRVKSKTREWKAAHPECTYNLDLSVGVEEFDPYGDMDPQRLLQLVDASMYMDKHSHRDDP